MSIKYGDLNFQSSQPVSPEPCGAAVNPNRPYRHVDSGYDSALAIRRPRITEREYDEEERLP